MSILSNFNKAFGLDADLDGEKNRFVQRINQSAFTEIHSHPVHSDYEDIFRAVCYELGIDPGPLIARANDENYTPLRRIPPLKSLTRSDFMETLKILAVLRNVLSNAYEIEMIERSIEIALAAAAVDLGVRWKDGMFYPSGAKELDEKLIEDNLEWLHVFPEVRKQFGTALEHFGKSLSDPAARKDAITNAYSAMERLARHVLKNKKSFEDNSNEIVSYLDLPKEYGSILHQYKQMAHQYSSRHAGSEWSHVETEAFVYLTGLLMRLISEKAPTSSEA